VSPVIGVILMVAITVILAAVIASFVLGLGPGEAQPQASFSFDGPDTSDNMNIIHDNGDAIKSSQLYIRGDVDSGGEWSGDASGSQDGESAVTSGDSWEVTIDATDDYSIRVVWDNGDNSATLSEKSGSV
jgi:flagellin-like protein